MAGTVITPSVLNSLFTAFNFKFQDAFKGVEPTWKKVAMETTSVTTSETYGWLGQVPRFREWIGERAIRALDSFGYTIANRTFENTIGIKREQIEDDQWGLFAPLFAELGRATAIFPDELVYGLLQKGATTKCYDGNNFFDTHAVKDANGNLTGVANCNLTGSGPIWYLFDTKKLVKPVILQKRREFQFVAKTNPNESDAVFLKNEYLYGVDGRLNVGFGLWQTAYASNLPLNRANLRAAINAMVTLPLDYGRPAGIVPDLLVTGASLRQVARDLILSDLLAVDGAPGEAVLSGAVGMMTNTDKNVVDLFWTPYLP